MRELLRVCPHDPANILYQFGLQYCFQHRDDAVETSDDAVIPIWMGLGLPVEKLSQAFGLH